ncbi:uncharacterized protein [Centruroides vittatus]|uniref:uncharacterized protein n=2 Tax=Centruroides vittatus TaxID=120091 RepID=UPI0035102622
MHTQNPAMLIELNRKVALYQEILQRSLYERYRKKLRWIIGKQKPKKTSQNPSLVCWDNISPPTYLTRALKHGPLYAPGDHIIQPEKVMPDVEHLITGLPEAQKEFYRWKVVSKISENNKRRQDDGFWSLIHASRKWLRQQNNVILRADKSKSLVLMKRCTYEAMMQRYINDTDCENAEDGYLQRLQARVKRFTQTKLAGEWGLRRAVVASPDVPRLFAFAKTHKDLPSLRPVLDKARSPTRALESAIHKLVCDQMRAYPWAIRNPIELVESLRVLTTTESTCITVLDFVSLFPSIKIQPCFCELRDILLARPHAYTHRKQILELAHILCYSSFFRFNNKTYVQKRGVPMGSPLSGDLCELVIRRLEQQIIPSFLTNILLYRRYVDDILIIWKAEPDINEFINAMNTNGYGLSVKLEQKSNTSAHFLDLDIQIRDNKITHKVFYKQCHVPLFIPASSEDPYSYKIAAFRALIKRAFTHNSKYEDTVAELGRIQEVASQHGYDRKIVYNMARKYARGNTRNNLQAGVRSADISARKIVEYNHHLDAIYREIASSTRNKITYRRPRSVYSLLRNGKDNLDMKHAPGVYEVPLWDDRFNRSLVYVGSTKRSLHQRLREHRYDIANNKLSTTLATYATQQGITADLKNARIIRMSQHTDQLRTLETLEIYKAGLHNTCINYKDAINISQAWKFCYEGIPHPQIT